MGKYASSDFHAAATGLVANSIGEVSETLDLNNGSLLPGNSQAPTCNNYVDVAATSTLGDVFATCWPDGLIDFNESSGVAEAYLTVGQEPSGLLFDNSNGYVYVADSGSNSISVVTTALPRVADTIPVKQ